MEGADAQQVQQIVQDELRRLLAGVNMQNQASGQGGQGSGQSSGGGSASGGGSGGANGMNGGMSGGGQANGNPTNGRAGGTSQGMAQNISTADVPRLLLELAVAWEQQNVNAARGTAGASQPSGQGQGGQNQMASNGQGGSQQAQFSGQSQQGQPVNGAAQQSQQGWQPDQSQQGQSAQAGPNSSQGQGAGQRAEMAQGSQQGSQQGQQQQGDFQTGGIRKLVRQARSRAGRAVSSADQAELIAQAQSEFTNELRQNLQRLRQVISESQELARRMQIVLGDGQDQSSS